MAWKLSTILGVAIIAADLMPAQAQDQYWKGPGLYDYDLNYVREPPVYNNLKATHPGYDIVSVAPADFKPKVGGMAFLPDGRLVLADWVSWGETKGRIYLLEGLSGPPGTAKATQIASGIWEPLGLTVAEGRIYYLSQSGIWTLENKVGTTVWTKKAFAPFPYPMKTSGLFPLAFGLQYRGGSFYYTLGGYANNNLPNNDGYVVRLGLTDKKNEILSRGLRNPNGLGFDSVSGDVYVTDNQGEWRSSSPIYHVDKDKHFQWQALGKSLPPVDSQQVPALWVPQGEAGCSLTDMFRMDTGSYAGQFLVGDNRYGSVGRASFEKVGGVSQGAYFLFSGILDAGGIYRFTQGPDGSIYWGALGSQQNIHWMWDGKVQGLLRMRRNGKPFFDLKDMRIVKDGFEIHFTEPASTAAGKLSAYHVHSWTYHAPAPTYGAPKDDFREITVSSVSLSADGLKAVLKLEGMTAGRVYRLTVDSLLTSTGNRSLWTNKAWYTVNVLSDQVPTLLAGDGAAAADRASGFSARVSGRVLEINLSEGGRYTLEVHNAQGRILARDQGLGPVARNLPVTESGLWWIKVTTKSGTRIRRVNGF